MFDILWSSEETVTAIRERLVRRRVDAREHGRFAADSTESDPKELGLDHSVVGEDVSPLQECR